MGGYDEVDGSCSDNTGEDITATTNSGESDSNGETDRDPNGETDEVDPFQLLDEPDYEDYWDYREGDLPPTTGVYPNRNITVDKFIDFNGDYQRHTITAEPMFNHYMDVLTSLNQNGLIYNKVLKDPTVKDHGLIQFHIEIGMEKPGDDGLEPVRDSFHIRSNPIRRFHGEDYVSSLKKL